MDGWDWMDGSLGLVEYRAPYSQTKWIKIILFRYSLPQCIGRSPGDFEASHDVILLTLNRKAEDTGNLGELDNLENREI